MTDQERRQRIEALLAQRASYEARGLPSSVAAVNRELAQLAEGGASPARRATTRVLKATGLR